MEKRICHLRRSSHKFTVYTKPWNVLDEIDCWYWFINCTWVLFIFTFIKKINSNFNFKTNILLKTQNIWNFSLTFRSLISGAKGGERQYFQRQKYQKHICRNSDSLPFNSVSQKCTWICNFPSAPRRCCAKI